MSAAEDPLASWDVFHADRLELERGLSTAAVRAALAAGQIRDDDLIRPAGTTAAWAPLGDLPEFLAPVDEAVGAPPSPDAAAQGPARPAPAEAMPPAEAQTSDFEVQSDDFDLGPVPAAEPTLPGPAWLQLGGEPDDVAFPVLDQRPSGPPSAPAGRQPPAPSAWSWSDDDDDDEEDGEPEGEDFEDPIEVRDESAPANLEILDQDELTVPSVHSREAYSTSPASRVALPVVPSRDWNEDRPPVETETDHPASFTLSRSGPMTVEELDLAPMVDVAFQLVLFFMVTATTVLYKTLEIPKPTADQPPGAVAQGHSRTLDDFKDDYVIVEIDSAGAMRIDHEPVPAEFRAVAERLRTAREKTNRKTMLLSADFATPHRHSVLAYDAANEIGMGIAIAKPKAPQGPGPSLVPGGAPPRAGPARLSGASAKSAPPRATAPAGPVEPRRPAAPAPTPSPFD